MYVKAILCKWTAAEADRVIWKILHYRIAYIAQKPRSRYDKMFCGLKRQKYADVQQQQRQQKKIYIAWNVWLIFQVFTLDWCSPAYMYEEPNAAPCQKTYMT